MRLIRLPGVFKPHSDSLMLADHARRERLPARARVLDLCTGSGVIALAVAMSHPDAEVMAVDISRRALATVRLNAALAGRRVRTVRGNLFEPLGEERFDLIVSNPPYVPTAHGHPARHSPSRAWEAGRDGRLFLDPICDQAARHLNPGGVLLLTHSTVCDERATLETLRSSELEVEVTRREPGPLGERLRARASWLRAQGLLDDQDREEILIIRACRPASRQAEAQEQDFLASAR